jgi:NAD(P)H-hydrate repair Nnr-like enzyme with NAD(P)H-hydrate dehydratase domain
VLTGLVAALAGAVAPIDAACLAVAAHARAAERWREATGASRGMLAGDLAAKVAEVMAGR